MKKQIFILVFLVLATFANVNVSYGQATASTTAPRGISCADDAMHPIAGKEYIYKAASNQAGSYTFWATKDLNFITTVGAVSTTNMATKKIAVSSTGLLTATNYAATAVTDNVKITWSDAILSATTTASPTFVAVNVVGATCADNFNVWSVTPIKAFTVDITNMNHLTKASLAYQIVESQCFDITRSAKWDIPLNKMLYDFGSEVLYFEVIAANFSASYTPTFQISGLGNGQTATIDWDITNTFPNPTLAVAIVNGTPVTSATSVTTNVTNTSVGVSIYVRVIIKNNTYEGTTATAITLAVDGQNSVGDWDIVNSTLLTPAILTCTTALAADQSDDATQTLNPRPTVTPAISVPVTTFVPGNQTN
jgi:hypothetical protein